MATILINGNEYTIPEGEKLNAIQMAKRVGHEIPYYCWHPSLSVVANCRMCEVEVGSKDPKTGEIKMIPKMVPGCQTPAKDGTVIVTDSPKVKEHQRMIMEYLLINHPLDCPVGALLDKDFLHRQRAWFLSRHDAICTRCATGCNISSEENRGEIWRFRARYNPKVNDHWICDEGRYSYKAANDPMLLAAMYAR